MTSVTDIVNRALNAVGTRTTVTDAELAGNLTNEAIQANIVVLPIRDQIIRMAPWTSAVKTANLTLIYAAPGTPENASPPTSQWQPGQPIPPWIYEYALPTDCLRAMWLQSTYVGVGAPTIPISPVTNYTTPSGSNQVPFKTQIDIVAGLPTKVLLTNSENPTLTYISQITDPNQMDALLQQAWVSATAAALVQPLTGDKKLREMFVQDVNRAIEMARGTDANEEFCVPDHTPDWIAVRGLGGFPTFNPFFNWGGLWG